MATILFVLDPLSLNRLEQAHLLHMSSMIKMYLREDDPNSFWAMAQLELINAWTINLTLQHALGLYAEALKGELNA